MDMSKYYNNQNEKPLDNIVDDGGFASIFRSFCCIGDSLSSGEFESEMKDGQRRYTDMFEYSWGQYLARMCASKTYNFSCGGMTASEYCKSFADDNDFWNEKYASQCYIIALGVNDLINQNQEIGSMESVDFDDYRNNSKDFAGYYGQIIQRMKAIQPDAKFFLMTMPRDCNDDKRATDLKLKHKEVLYDFANSFTNVYVIDLNKYAPVYDEQFKNHFYLLGHMNPMGYILTAKMVASYIDYIIRNNPDDFRQVGFIGTDILDS